MNTRKILLILILVYVFSSLCSYNENFHAQECDNSISFEMESGIHIDIKPKKENVIKERNVDFKLFFEAEYTSYFLANDEGFYSDQMGTYFNNGLEAIISVPSGEYELVCSYLLDDKYCVVVDSVRLVEGENNIYQVETALACNEVSFLGVDNSGNVFEDSDGLFNEYEFIVNFDSENWNLHVTIQMRRDLLLTNMDNRTISFYESYMNYEDAYFITYPNYNEINSDIELTIDPNEYENYVINIDEELCPENFFLKYASVYWDEIRTSSWPTIGNNDSMQKNLYFSSIDRDNEGYSIRYLIYSESDSNPPDVMFYSPNLKNKESKLYSTRNLIPNNFDEFVNENEELNFKPLPYFFQLFPRKFLSGTYLYTRVLNGQQLYHRNLAIRTHAIIDDPSGIIYSGLLKDIGPLNLTDDNSRLTATINSYNMYNTECSVTLITDLSMDTNSLTPYLSSIRVFGEDQVTSHRFEQNDEITMHFMISDFNYDNYFEDYEFTFQQTLLENVSVQYREHGNVDWYSLPVELIGEFPDFAQGSGVVFSSDLSALNILDNMKYDIKIAASDTEGNYSEQLLEPFIFIETVATENDGIIAYDCNLNSYPNPFIKSDSSRDVVTISLNVKKGETADLEIFNIKGQSVKTISQLKEGKHIVTWDGKDSKDNELGSGVYYYRLKSESVNQVRKLVMIK